jgi:hypothetical protein
MPIVRCGRSACDGRPGRSWRGPGRRRRCRPGRRHCGPLRCGAGPTRPTAWPGWRRRRSGWRCGVHGTQFPRHQFGGVDILVHGRLVRGLMDRLVGGLIVRGPRAHGLFDLGLDLLVLLGRHAAETVGAVDQSQQTRSRVRFVATKLKHMRQIQLFLIAAAEHRAHERAQGVFALADAGLTEFCGDGHG